MKVKPYPIPGKPIAAIILLLALVRLVALMAVTDDSAFVERLGSVRDGEAWVVRGRIVKPPRLRTQATVRLVLAVDQVRFQPEAAWRSVDGQRLEVHVYTRGRKGQKGDIRADLPALITPSAYGDEIEVTCRGRPRPPTRHQPPCVRTYWKNTVLVRSASGNPVMEIVFAAKRHLMRSYQELLPGHVFALAAGAVLGERGPVRTGNYGDHPISTLFADAGIGHVLAVSGLHVGILAAGMVMLLRALRVQRRHRILPMALVLGAYMLLTGARPATVRATLMALIAITASGFKGCSAFRSVWAGVGASAAIMLVWQPRLILDAGFQLSYCAVLSLLVLTRPVCRALSRASGAVLICGGICMAITVPILNRHADVIWSGYGLVIVLAGWRAASLAANAMATRIPILGRHTFRRLPRPLQSLIAAQCAIQLGMVIPLGSFYFGHFSTAGTVVNLFAIPLIAVFVQAALLTGTLNVIPCVGGILAWLPKWVTIGSGLLFFRVAELGADTLPCVSVPRPSALLLCAWYAALAYVFFGRRLRVRLGLRRLRPMSFIAGARNTQEVAS